MKKNKPNLQELENLILSIEDDLYEYCLDDELYKVMELTKNKSVFLKCMENIEISYLQEKIKNPKIPKKMILKLTAHPKEIIQSSILERKDTDAQTLKILLKNFKKEKHMSNRHLIINHQKMDEETLYELTNCKNNEILSLIILSDKVSPRILEKLQQSKDEEIRTMAKVRDPRTDAKYIKKVIKKQIPKALKIKGDYIDKYLVEDESLLMNDILEAAIKNPKLPSELVDLYKGFCKTATLLFIIPHPNISKKRLDIYHKLGDDEVKKAVEKAKDNKIEIDK